MKREKTAAQLRCIFGLGRTLKMAKEDLEELVFDMTEGKVERLSLLSFEEANALIERLGGEPFPVRGSRRAGQSKRNQQYKRQVAGVAVIITPRQRKYLNDLKDKRGMSDEGFERMCRRTIKKPRPRTTKDANVMIEALKNMIDRDPIPPGSGRVAA